MRALDGLKIIITRPEAQARPWQADLQSLGAQTFLLPVMQIVPVASDAQRQQIQRIASQLDQFQKIIFVSQNAVAQARAHFPLPPVKLEAFAVGKATAGAVRDWGMAVTEGGDAMNSESLLALDALSQAKVKGEHIVICRGVGGRPTLGETLRDRGAKVEYCELYHRRPHPQAPANLNKLLAETSFREPCEVVSTHSGESVALLAALLRERGESAAAIFNLPLLVPGARVETVALQLGFRDTICAINAGDEMMTRALVDWWAQRGKKT